MDSNIDSYSSSIADQLYEKQACLKCGGTETKLGAGKTPKTASLACADCGKFIQWLTKAKIAKLVRGAK